MPNDDDTFRRQSDDERLSRLEHALGGNGGPGLTTRLTEVERVLRGDSLGSGGIVGRLARIERLLFDDPATGEKGLVYDVRSLTATVEAFRTSVRTLNWLLAVFGTGGAGAFLWTLFTR